MLTLHLALVTLAVMIPALVLRLWRGRRKIQRMKRNFREAYQDWKNGNPGAHGFALQWHHRLSRSRR
jgi:hypothetical protein